jgi:nucleoside-diphosphate-sugar epimerase
MSIIVFGGHGFIGGHLCKLLKKKYKIHVYGNKNFSKKSNSSYIEYNKKNFIKIIKKTKPTVIFFLSGNSYPINSLEDELYDFKTSNFILQKLLTAMGSTKFNGKIIYSSSIAVYGSFLKKKIVTEKSSLNPVSYYGLSKSLAEKQIKFFSNKFSFKALVLRICSVYGPGLRRQIIYQLIKKILKSKDTVYLKGNFHDSRQFIYVSDCINVMEKLMHINLKKNFNIYNLSQGKKISIKKIFKQINFLLEKNLKVYFTNKIIQPNLPELCNKRIVDLLSIKYFVSLEKGLKKTIQYLIKKNV